MTPLKQEVDDDMNEEYDEAVPLVTADTPTNNGLRPTVPSALQIEGSEGEADDTWTTKRKKPMSKQHQSRLRLVLICVIVSMILVFYSKQRNTTASIDEHQTTTAQHHIEVVRKPNMTPKSVRTLREQVMGYLAADYVIGVLYDAMDELATQLMTSNALSIYQKL